LTRVWAIAARQFEAISNMKREKTIKDLIDRASPVFDDIANGLTFEEVERRKKEGLVNTIKHHVTKTYAQIIFTNLVSFFNITLVAIGIFMIIAEQYSGLFFLFVLFANIVIGLFQDIRARILVDKLQLITNPKATVVRGGTISDINVSDLVLSDILILKSGDQISIDSTVVDGEVIVNESLLTGESAPLAKQIGAKVLSGSFVTSGTARVRATSVGRANYAEQLQAQAKLFKRPKSEILKSVRSLFRYIGLIVILFAIAYVITFAAKGNFATYDGFKSAIGAIAGSLVAMIPSGMYLLTSMTLAVGVIRLAYHRMLVQELYSIEALARVDVLCFDKTGTLTDGNMNVKSIIAIASEDKTCLYRALSSLLMATKDDNHTAQALLEEVGKDAGYQPLKTVPFSSERKYAAAVLEGYGSIAIGALEFVCPKLDGDVRRLVAENSKRGHRVLIAAKSDCDIADGLPRDMVCIGVIILQDHIRDDASANIEWFKKNGVAIKIISGDNVDTVSEIARMVGVEGADKCISLEGVILSEVAQLADGYNVFGRVSPEQKEVLVQSLRSAGHTVAMTGDGVNDILALKVADCSIAMASGSSAARNVSHLVALDSDFSRLSEVVDEGRRVINNLQRTCSVFLAKTAFAIVASLVFLIASWFGGGGYPFETNNMYIWEVCTIGLAAFFLALQKNSERLKGSFLGNIVSEALPGGIMQLALVLLIYTLTFVFPGTFTLEAARAMAIIAFTIASYFILAKISWPLDSYRLILFLAIAALGIATLIIDYFLRSWGILKIPYESLSPVHVLALFILLVVAVPFYLLISKLIKNAVDRRQGGGKYAD